MGYYKFCIYWSFNYWSKQKNEQENCSSQIQNLNLDTSSDEIPATEEYSRIHIEEYEYSLLNEDLQRWLFISTSQPRNIKCNSVFPFKRWKNDIREYANQMRKMKSLGLYCLLDDDFGKWPTWFSDTMRMFLAKHILMQINCFDFPFCGYHRKSNTSFYIKVCSTGKRNFGNWLLYSNFKDKVLCFTVKCLTTSLQD